MSFDFRVRKFFTPQEASRLLPDIKPRIRELMDKRKVAVGLRAELDRYVLLGYSASEMADKAAQLDALRSDMGDRIDELEDIGLKVRDLEFGMVDFPADRFGENVLLCWVYGEPEVSYWHSLAEGYMGRRAVKLQLIQP